MLKILDIWLTPMIRRRGDRRVRLKHRVLRRTEQSSSSGKQEAEKEQEPEEVSLDCKTSSGFQRSPKKLSQSGQKDLLLAALRKGRSQRR